MNKTGNQRYKQRVHSSMRERERERQNSEENTDGFCFNSWFLCLRKKLQRTDRREKNQKQFHVKKEKAWILIKSGRDAEGACGMGEVP